jgi:NAD+ kinase
VFKHVGLIGKRDDERVVTTLKQLIAYLQKLPLDIRFDAESARAHESFGLELADRDTLGRVCDLVIVVGGDGTFLSAARSLVGEDVRLLGINLGRLGFLADIMPGEMVERLQEVFSGRFEEEERSLLRASIVRGGTPVIDTNALNDVVAHKWNIARLIEFETYINSRLVNRQRSDGLIVATPTGSTAYALSGGGPILFPSLNAMVLVPICPHNLTSRPIVVDGSSRIEVVMHASQRGEAQLTCDGQTALELEPGDRICIEQDQRRLRLVHPPGHEYWATLRAKLHWGKEL